MNEATSVEYSTQVAFANLVLLARLLGPRPELGVPGTIRLFNIDYALWRLEDADLSGFSFIDCEGPAPIPGVAVQPSFERTND